MSSIDLYERLCYNYWMITLTPAQHAIKQHMLHFPSLYGIDKWKVLECLASGSPDYGYWNDDGTLNYQPNLSRGRIPYKDIEVADLTEAQDDLDKAQKEYDHPEHEYLRDLSRARLVKARKYMNTCEFLNSNIDLIVSSPVDIMNTYVPLSYHMRPKYVSLPGSEHYCKTTFFGPPENMPKDWCAEFADFGKLWLMSLRTYYQIGRDKESHGMGHWPEKAIKVHEAIQKQIIHFEAIASGRTREQILKAKQEFASEIQKILDDTK